TGQYCHNNGMLGLAHRGWSLNDYGEHLVHPLRTVGYRSVLIGEQHISEDPAVIGYDEVIEVDSHHAQDVAPITIEALQAASEPFFFSVGFFETHRQFRAPTSVRDSGYSRDPAGHGGLQGQRPLPRPGDRRGAQRPARPRPDRTDADHLHD